jgi:hypothetical protein
VCGGANRPPVGVADDYQTPTDVILQVIAPNGILANDSDPDGQSISAVLVDGVDHGTLVAFYPEGTFEYHPTPGFRGVDTFTYRATDGVAQSEETSVTITVDRRPVAAPDHQSRSPAGAAVVLAAPGLLVNDTDGDSDALTAVLATNPAHGTVTVSSSGGFTYIPTAGFRGADTFTYQADDGLLRSSPATVSLLVNGKPTANADSYQTPYGTALSVAASSGVLANDVDPDGDILAASTVTAPAHGTLTLSGTGSISYAPSPGFSGDDTFTYHINDGTEDSAPATVTVTVAPTTVPPPPGPTPACLAAQAAIKATGQAVAKAAAKLKKLKKAAHPVAAKIKKAKTELKRAQAALRAAQAEQTTACG